jgi:DNA-binding response OmpR family regulator
MYYKIISKNRQLKTKIENIISTLGLKHSKHIQEVDIRIVDTSTLCQQSLLSYKNKNRYSNILFITNSDKDISTLLQNSLTDYIKKDFTNSELLQWCIYFINNQKDNKITLSQDIEIDFKSSTIIHNNKNINITKKELLLLKELSISKFVDTNTLTHNLELSSTSSTRAIISRLRKKLPIDIIEQNKSLGYKLIGDSKKESSIYNSYTKELEEQNRLMQSIVDNSSIFIVTFIHNQLYCINKAFREYLGLDIINEIWHEERGDFFKIIDYYNSDIKDNLLQAGLHKIKIYHQDISKRDYIVESIYFENLDKHLLILKSI